MRNHYRLKAEECLLLAEELRDPVERLKLLEVASSYRALARHLSGRHQEASALRATEHDPAQRRDDA